MADINEHMTETQVKQLHKLLKKYREYIKADGQPLAARVIELIEHWVRSDIEDCDYR